MICTAARKSASCSMKSTATPKSVMTRLSAACTGLREVTTPTAPTRITAAAAAKTRMSGQVGRVAASSRTAWSMGQSLPSAAPPRSPRRAVPSTGADRRLARPPSASALASALAALRAARRSFMRARMASIFLRLRSRPLLGPPDPALHAAVGQRDVLVEQVGLEHLAQRLGAGGLVVAVRRLAALGGTHAVAELARPLHLALVGGAARRGGGAHPARRHRSSPSRQSSHGSFLGVPSSFTTSSSLV